MNRLKIEITDTAGGKVAFELFEDKRSFGMIVNDRPQARSSLDRQLRSGDVLDFIARTIFEEETRESAS